MADAIRKGTGRVKAIIVLVFVVMMVALLAIQTWPGIVDTAGGGQGQAAGDRITVTVSSTPLPATGTPAPAGSSTSAGGD